MSWIDSADFQKIKAEIQRSWPKLETIAEKYVLGKLPEHRRGPSQIYGIATLFITACGDFLARGKQQGLDDWAVHAKILKSAASILRQNPGARFLFKVLMSDDTDSLGGLQGAEVDYRRWDEKTEIITVTGEEASVTFAIRAGIDDNVVTPRAEQAISALEIIARQVEIGVRQHENIKRNQSFFYCLGARMRHSNSDIPLPDPAQANSVYKILIEAIRTVAPSRLADFKPKYDLRAHSEITSQ